MKRMASVSPMKNTCLASSALRKYTPMGTVTANRTTHAPSTRVAYVVTSGLTANNLRVRRRAAIECDDYFEDWGRLRGVVMHVRAKFVRGGEELSRARMLLRQKFKQYRDYEIDDVIALKVEAVTSWGL